MKSIKYTLSLLLCLLAFNSAYTQVTTTIPNSFTATSQKEYLPQEKAFFFSAQLNKKDLLEIKWGAEEQYHLYHDSFHFEIVSPTVKIGNYKIPPGHKKYIAVLGKEVEEHTGVFTMIIPISGTGNFILKASAQGCADNGICYPPFTREITLKNPT